MATKRRPLHTATKLNFRPSVSDVNVEQRGTKPTSEPVSIKETIILMVLYLCKKSLFFDTNLKVAVYLGTLFIISLIGDVATIPKMYLSRSDNFFNRYFVKFAWGWNLLLIIPFVVFTTYIYCCGQKRRIIKDHLLRIVIATFFWWFWTTLFNIIEASFGRCGQRSFRTKAVCLQSGNVWNGFDISGHSFILIYGSLFLIEEARCIENWDSIKDYLRLENHHRLSNESSQNLNPLRNLDNDQIKELQFYYKKYTPTIRTLFITITLFQLMWDVMLICTMLYYHVMIEKFLAGVIAVLTWFVTYRIWYAHPKLIPSLPGDGVFQIYEKESNKDTNPTVRRRTGSLVNDARGPMFMGRPIYPQQNQQDERYYIIEERYQE